MAVGTCLFTGCGAGKTSISKVTPTMVPFFGAMVAALMVITYLNLGYEHDRSYFSQRGWHRLDSGDADAKWTRFLQIYSDGKIVGLPWIKWEISKPVQIRHADELRTSILRAMKQSGAEEDWFALDFNHPCYSFRPQEIDETLEDWPIPDNA